MLRHVFDSRHVKHAFITSAETNRRPNDLTLWSFSETVFSFHAICHVSCKMHDCVAGVAWPTLSGSHAPPQLEKKKMRTAEENRGKYYHLTTTGSAVDTYTLVCYLNTSLQLSNLITVFPKIPSTVVSIYLITKNQLITSWDFADTAKCVFPVLFFLSLIALRQW